MYLLLVISNLIALWPDNVVSEIDESFGICSGWLCDLVHGNFHKFFVCASEECYSPFIEHSGLCLLIKFIKGAVHIFCIFITFLLDILTTKRRMVQYHNDSFFL